MPSSAGGTTWFDDWGEHWKLPIIASSQKGYIDFTVNGEPTGGTTTNDATVYKTNNPGIGIAYQMSYSNAGVLTPNKDFTAPFRLDVDSNVNASGDLIIRYMLVRLTDELPAGPITEVPSVTVSYHNPADSGYGDGLSWPVLVWLVSQSIRLVELTHQQKLNSTHFMGIA